MAKQSKAEKLIEVATTDRRVIAAEVALIGLGCLYLKRRLDGDEAEWGDFDSAEMVSRHSGHDSADTFAHVYTPVEEGIPFKFGAYIPSGNSYLQIGVSGVVKLAGRAHRSFPELAITESSANDLLSLNRLKEKMSELRSSLRHELNRSANPSENSLQ